MTNNNYNNNFYHNNFYQNETEAIKELIAKKKKNEKIGKLLMKNRTLSEFKLTKIEKTNIDLKFKEVNDLYDNYHNNMVPCSPQSSMPSMPSHGEKPNIDYKYMCYNCGTQMIKEAIIDLSYDESVEQCNYVCDNCGSKLMLWEEVPKLYEYEGKNEFRDMLKKYKSNNPEKIVNLNNENKIDIKDIKDIEQNPENYIFEIEI